MLSCKSSLDLLLLVLDSDLKAVGPIYSLSSNRIALFFFDPGSSFSFRVALRREAMKKMVFGIRA